MKSYGLQLRTLLIVGMTVLITACASVPVGPPLTSNETAPPPAVAVGDQWTYRVRDGYTGIDRGTERYRVEQVSAGNIMVARIGFGGEDTEAYDSQWNWLKRPATNLQSFTYRPPYPAFAFPLAPGKTWQVRLTATDPADGRHFPVRVDGKVLGWERVKVPAGEFDAIKIQRYVYLDYWEQGVRGASHIVEDEWYAPAVKQSVRREAKSRYWSLLGALETGFIRVGDGSKGDGGPRFLEDNWLVYELVSYSAR
jgi:hypothetical protein